ncbi:MAG: DUF1801 domain-containing protein [Bacteroidota bacterium]
MDPIEAYILDLPSEKQRVLFSEAHQLILSLVTPLESRLKWKIPFYQYRKKGLCYLNPKDDILYIGFPYGNQLANHQGQLESLRLKQVRTLSIPDLETLHQETTAEYLIESMLVINQLLDHSDR